MNSVRNRIDNKERRRPSVLRRTGDAWLRALARHTPAGPGSLSTGQAAIARHRQPCDCPDRVEPDEGAPGRYPSYMEFAAALRQVYWI